MISAVAGAFLIGAWVAASCSLIAFLYGVPVTLGNFWRGTILAGLGVMLLAEMVGIGAAL